MVRWSAASIRNLESFYSRHFVPQLLRDFDREARLGDLFERDFAIDKASLSLDRANDIADAFLRRNPGVIEARLNDAVRI